MKNKSLVYVAHIHTYTHTYRANFTDNADKYNVDETISRVYLYSLLYHMRSHHRMSESFSELLQKFFI